jgi:hypothetical protein
MNCFCRSWISGVLSWLCLVCCYKELITIAGFLFSAIILVFLLCVSVLSLGMHCCRDHVYLYLHDIDIFSLAKKRLVLQYLLPLLKKKRYDLSQRLGFSEID